MIMPPEKGTIAPEADLTKNSSAGSADSFRENPPPSAPPPFDTSEPDGLQAPDIEEAVIAADEHVGVAIEAPPTKNDDGEIAPLATTTTITTSQSQQRTSYPPSFFTNERGNLKAVALVVRNPCLIFWLIIAICIIITFLLVVLVFRTADGSPFTVPSNEFAMNDERSLQYDSLRLAKDEVMASRKAFEQGDTVTLKQSELSAVAIWVFESDEGNDKGVFGSKESIEGMKSAYDIFMDDPEYQDYCYLDYRTQVSANETRPCQMPLTPLAMYYASEWYEEKVGSLIEELKDPEKLELFNSLALCYTAGLYCELVPDDVTMEDIAWVTQLGATIGDITSKFDMKGELVENFDQVTELASYLIQVDVFKGTVDYGFDTGFSSDNPISM